MTANGSPLSSAAAAQDAVLRAPAQTVAPAANRTPRMAPSIGVGDTIAFPALARADSPTRSPRSASISLQAAATMNAGIQNELSRRSSSSSVTRARQSPKIGRRRSVVLMNLHHNDPTIPAPGEMVTDNRISSPRGSFSASPIFPARDINHHRTPSLGELHQELEAEQEGQVNRLLQMIRQQQLQLHQLQLGTAQTNTTAVQSESTSAGAERSGQGTPLGLSGSQTSPNVGPLLGSTHQPSACRSPVVALNSRSSFDIARADLHRRSRTSSRNPSPRLRSTSIGADSALEQCPLGARDESAFYQAETQMLVRENQMLRHRIRELEKQLAETVAPLSALTHEPVHPSGLSQSLSATTPSEAAG